VTCLWSRISTDRLSILYHQILEAIKLLQEAKTIPIQRARMRIRLTMPSKDGKRLKEEILKNVEKVCTFDTLMYQHTLILMALLQVALIDPGSFRIINELLQKEVKGKDRARVETLSFAAVEGDERIE
jgi:ribosome maturation protein SDO1